MAFIRKIKKKSGTYMAEVENYRKDGKVKQRVIRYLGVEVNGQAQKKIFHTDIEIEQVKEHLQYQVIDHIAKELHLHDLLGEHAPWILLMTYSHLTEHLSIHKLKDWFEQTELPSILGLSDISSRTLYDTLDQLQALDFDKITQHINRQWTPILRKQEQTAVILDITDTYFNGTHTQWKRRRGKDGKYDKLIQIGLAVSGHHGFPLKHKVYEGNIGNSRIMQDFLADIKALGLHGVVMDRGMFSYENMQDWEALKVPCIIGMKRNEKIERDILSAIERDDIYSPENQIRLKKTTVYAQSFNFHNGQLVVIYNPLLEVAKRDKAFAEGQSIQNLRYSGYSLIFHSTGLGTAEVVRKYFDKDLVEKSFHHLKGLLGLHPLRVWLIKRIQAHVKLCYLSLCILTYMNYKLLPLKLSAIEAIDLLSSAYKVYLKNSKDNFTWSKTVTLKSIQQKILKTLKCSV